MGYCDTKMVPSVESGALYLYFSSCSAYQNFVKLRVVLKMLRIVYARACYALAPSTPHNSLKAAVIVLGQKSHRLRFKIRIVIKGSKILQDCSIAHTGRRFSKAKLSKIAH